MADWEERLGGFLKLWDREILQDAGRVTAELAKTHAETEFEKYRIVQDRLFESDFDRLLKRLEQGEKKEEAQQMEVFNPKFTITNRMTAAITQIERARGFLEAARLSDDWVRDMGNKALIKEAHHTTHIEGTQLTLDQAERLWRGEAVPEADPDDARELLNYRSAFEFVSECLDSGDPITEGLIREIHRKLVEGVRGGKADPGNYRRIQNYVVRPE